MSFTTTETIEGALAQYLMDSTAVADIVGTSIHPYIGAEKFPRPKLTYFRVSTDRDFNNDGPNYAPRARIQFDAWTDDYLTARRLINAVRHALDGMRDTIYGWTIQGIHTAGEQDQPVNAPDPGKDKPIQRISLDMYVDYCDKDLPS